jgi:hypothetical protein
MGKLKESQESKVPAFVITAKDGRLDEVRLQVDQTVPAAAAFEIVKILAGAEIDRVRDRKPREVTS